MRFSVAIETIYFDPKDRKSWRDGGDWPYETLYHYYEACVAAHFTMRGYYVIRDYVATRPTANRPIAASYTKLFHEVIGQDVSRFLMEEVDRELPAGKGQPDLFVFRDEYPNDPRVHFRDPRRWFFVEVKGPSDKPNENQKKFWRLIAEAADMGLGQDKLRLFSVLPTGQSSSASELWY